MIALHRVRQGEHRECTENHRAKKILRKMIGTTEVDIPTESTSVINLVYSQWDSVK